MQFRHCFQWSFYKNIVLLSSQGLRRCIRRGPRRQGGVSWTGQRLRGVEGSRGVESSGGAVTAGDHSSGSGKNRVSVRIREANRQAGRSPLLRPPHTCKMNFQSTELQYTVRCVRQYHQQEIFADAYAARVYDLQSAHHDNDHKNQTRRWKPLRTEKRPRQDVDG